ncbi:MAG: ribonuclease D [Gemmatimonadales bacterium]
MSSDLPIEFVQTPSAFLELIERFRHEPVIGIDTEAASFHRYHDRVYLLQLSSAEQTAVVDPIAVGGLQPMEQWFADPDTEFVFHDADYDLRLLHREFGFRVGRLFDTRVAAQFLGLPGIGLAAILEQRFGVTTNKKWQRADWSARPLSPEMVTYAATDTRYLPSLRTLFRDELTTASRLSWVEEECTLTRLVEWAPPDPPESAFLRVKGARDLDRRGLAILRELYQWREVVAARLDRALFRVVATETLLLLATERPTCLEALQRIKGIGADTLARRGTEILAAIHRGLAVDEHALPGFERRPRFRPDPAFEARVDRLKAWRARLVERIGLPPGLLAPNGTLEGIARNAPSTLEQLQTVPGIRRWQVAEFGDEMLRAALGG